MTTAALFPTRADRALTRARRLYDLADRLYADRLDFASDRARHRGDRLIRFAFDRGILDRDYTQAGA